MKPLSLLIFLCLALAPAAEAGVKAIAPDKAAIEAALTNKSDAAKASWWGFDPEDSTDFLQAAINSGVRKLIIEDLGAPWVTRGLKLASHQEIVFEKDVVILAKRGAFKGRTESLFTAIQKENITLTGHGATLRMWKEDYANPEKYEKAEWRNVLSFRSCSKVKVSGLTLADSGGDGIYLGVTKNGSPCSDFVIKDVRCINNYRQGISVISARNLLIEDCLLKDTSGTNPQAGIDFEPNNPGEELINCVMRNCVSENNTGRGFLFALAYTDETTKPISVRLENCRSIGNSASLDFATTTKGGGTGVRGTAEFIDCEFIDSEGPGILVRNKTINGATVRFENCTITNPAAKQPEMTPIQFTSSRASTHTFGAVHFENCTIEDSLERLPISYRDASGSMGIDQITGSLQVKKAGSDTVTYQLTKELVAEWIPHPSYKEIPQFPLESSSLIPAQSGRVPGRSGGDPARQRGASTWLLWAEAGDQVSYEASVRRVGKSVPQRRELSLFSPSGDLVEPAHPLEQGDNSFRFEAKETGAYKIVVDINSWATAIHSPSHRVSLVPSLSYFHFYATVGDLYLWRPAGNEEFAVKVTGDDGNEMVKASLIDPHGNVIEEVDNISVAHQFIVSTPAQEDEIWGLRLERPSKGNFEDYFVRVQGVPALLAPSPSDLLRPAVKDTKTSPKP